MLSRLTKSLRPLASVSVKQLIADGRRPASQSVGTVSLPRRRRGPGYFPREVFFFGFGFAELSLPAAVARAFCFFVATSASSRCCRAGPPPMRTVAPTDRSSVRAAGSNTALSTAPIVLWAAPAPRASARGIGLGSAVQARRAATGTRARCRQRRGRACRDADRRRPSLPGLSRRRACTGPVSGHAGTCRRHCRGARRRSSADESGRCRQTVRLDEETELVIAVDIARRLLKRGDCLLSRRRPQSPERLPPRRPAARLGTARRRACS